MYLGSRYPLLHNFNVFIGLSDETREGYQHPVSEVFHATDASFIMGESTCIRLYTLATVFNTILELTYDCLCLGYTVDKFHCSIVPLYAGIGGKNLGAVWIQY